jgi:hypothetical protein
MNVAVTRALSLATGVAIASAGFVGIAAATHTPPAHLKTTTLTLKATHERLTSGGNIKGTITGHLRSHKTGLVDETVTVQERRAGKTKWTDTEYTGTTDENGKVQFAFVQTNNNEQYRLVFAGDSTYKKSHSGVIAIRRSKVATEGS